MSPSVDFERIAGWLERAWLDRYLNRELTDAETDWFEAYVLDKDDLIAAIDIDSDLRQEFFFGKQRSNEKQQSLPMLMQLSDPTSANGSSSELAPTLTKRGLRQNVGLRWLPVAAAVVLGMGGGWLARSAHDSNGVGEFVTSPTRVIFDAMRGEGPIARVEHPDSQSRYVLIEAVIPPGAKNIKLKATNQDTRDLTQAPDGFVSFLVERKILSGLRNITIEYTVDGNKSVEPLAVPTATGESIK